MSLSNYTQDISVWNAKWKIHFPSLHEAIVLGWALNLFVKFPLLQHWDDKYQHAHNLEDEPFVRISCAYPVTLSDCVFPALSEPRDTWSKRGRCLLEQLLSLVSHMTSHVTQSCVMPRLGPQIRLHKQQMCFPEIARKSVKAHIATQLTMYLIVVTYS